jgi:hypothetical protein
LIFYGYLLLIRDGTLLIQLPPLQIVCGTPPLGKALALKGIEPLDTLMNRTPSAAFLGEELTLSFLFSDSYSSAGTLYHSFNPRTYTPSTVGDNILP